MPLARYPLTIQFPNQVVMDFLSKKERKECDCDKCKVMCANPCWPTPLDAKKLIDAGYADKMNLRRTQVTLDNGNAYEPVWVLSMADKRYQGEFTDQAWNYCIMQDDDGHCKIHDTDLKPLEAILAYHDESDYDYDLHEWIIESWCNNEALDLIEEWAEIVGYELPNETEEDDEEIEEKPKQLDGSAMEIMEIIRRTNIDKDFRRS